MTGEAWTGITYLLTVAGDATDRSSGSNIIVIGSDSDMISPDVKHSFLLSSSTCSSCVYAMYNVYTVQHKQMRGQAMCYCAVHQVGASLCKNAMISQLCQFKASAVYSQLHTPAHHKLSLHHVR
jgi:hypothetical protein